MDGKINIDGNALYRQPKLKSMRDTSQEDERENRASDWELNYIPLGWNYWLYGEWRWFGYGNYGCD